MITFAAHANSVHVLNRKPAPVRFGQIQLPDFPYAPLKLRHGTPADFAGVYDLMERVLPGEFPNGRLLLDYVREKKIVEKELTEAMKLGTGSFMVIENEKGILVGSAALMPANVTIHQPDANIHGPEKVCEVTKVYLDPQYRGRKIGKFLMNELLRQGKVLGYQKVFLAALKEFSTAISMYKSVGFTQLAQNIVHQDEYTLEMEKPL